MKYSTNQNNNNIKKNNIPPSLCYQHHYVYIACRLIQITYSNFFPLHSVMWLLWWPPRHRWATHPSISMTAIGRLCDGTWTAAARAIATAAAVSGGKTVCVVVGIIIITTIIRTRIIITHESRRFGRTNGVRLRPQLPRYRRRARLAASVVASQRQR